MGGGRTAHFGLCVAVARSCVGLESCRAGVSRARAVPAPAPAPLQALLLLLKDDCDRVRSARLWTESVWRQGLGRSVWWVAGVAQGQEILNKMRALLCSALLLLVVVPATLLGRRGLPTL